MTGPTKRLTFTIELSYLDYGAFEHVLTEGINALTQDAEMWEVMRPGRAEADREGIILAERLLEALHPAAQTFFADEIAKRNEEGRRLLAEHFAQLEAKIAEQAALDRPEDGETK